MKVIKNHQECEDPINYLGLEELAEEGVGGDCTLFYGGHANKIVFQPSDSPKYFFTTEEQTHAADTTDNFVDHVDKILTICPPSITGRAKRQACFFPFNEKFIPKTWDKEFDVIYCGLATGDHVTAIMNVIPQFDYRFVSFHGGGRVTNVSPTYLEKIDLISRSRITMVHNLTGSNTPQIKTRPFEAAFCKSLILCKRDEWNIIEEWFEPDKEFLYFSNETELKQIIIKVLTNYEDYHSIIDAAHDRATHNYTTRHFIKTYLK